MPPTASSCGSTTTVYVPVTGNVRVSTKPPFAPTYVVEPRLAPAGVVSEILAAQQFDVPMVTSERARLTRAPATP